MKLYEDYEFPEGDHCIICGGNEKKRVFEIPHIREDSVVLHRYHVDCYTQAILFSPSQPVDNKEL